MWTGVGHSAYGVTFPSPLRLLIWLLPCCDTTTLLFFLILGHEREYKQERAEGEKENLKQAALSVQSQPQGSIPQPWDMN